MRAKSVNEVNFVKESISFQRGLGSKTSLNVGQTSDEARENLSKEGKLWIDGGEYKVKLYYFPSKSPNWRDTNHSIYVKPQISDIIGDFRHFNSGKTYRMAIPPELDELNEKYRKANPFSSGFYFIFAVWKNNDQDLWG